MSKQVITFHYELQDDGGVTIDSSREAEPMAFLEGSGQIIPGLEPALLTLDQGKVEKVVVPYDEAYGPYDQSLVAKVPRTQFPTPEIKAGDIFQVEKEGAIRLITVVEVTPETVTVDANHPLAGKNLTFFIEVMGRREATTEEVAHGHVHQPGGHQH
jgi:FKBP-type peptidyl-prolyl cis-trans isomerase SlyD